MQTLNVGQHGHFLDHTYSYKQFYTSESSQNEISTNKSIDSAHCETFSQCQPRKGIQNFYARNRVRNYIDNTLYTSIPGPGDGDFFFFSFFFTALV